MTLLSESNGEKAKIEEEQKPQDIALAIFRFKARRGTGVYYTLLSTAPILVGLLETFSAPAYATLVSVGFLVVGILSLSRYAGMKRFYQMELVMGFFEQNQKRWGYRLGGLLYGVRTVVVTLLPLVAASIFVVTGNAILSSLVLVAFVAYILAYYFLVVSKQTAENVLPLRVEDWLVAFFPPSLLLLYFFQVLGTTAYLATLLLVLLLAGIKSSYDAPQALVQVLSDRDTFRRETPSKNKDAVDLSDIASGGALSSSTRVGIMLALLGVEQITFTDLMIAIKVSKSSLNHSVNALADVGYVTVRKGFMAAGGPRTFIRITKEGKKAIRFHLENMQTLASKFLN